MTLSLIERSRADVQRALASELHGPVGADALQRTLAAEHMRAAAYFGSTQRSATGALLLVHTTRLMTNLRRNLDGLWPAAAGESRTDSSETEPDGAYRSTLNDLAAIGDLVSTGGGFWVSAPLRLVETSEPESLLVFGGAPREVVGTAIGAKVECVAASRFVRRSDLKSKSGSSDLIQSLDTWLGVAEPLPIWTQRTISDHLQRLSQSEELAADQLEIYAPDLYRDRRKVARWMPATEINRPLGEPRLCRPTSHVRAYARPHYLGIFDFRNNRLTLRRSVPVDFQTSRRLPFGLDEMFKAPRPATLSVSEHACVVDLRYRLPEPENRVLSLAWKTTSSSAETSDHVTLHRSAMPALVHALQRLSINPTIVSRSR